MFSLMTVVLPQHTANGPTARSTAARTTAAIQGVPIAAPKSTEKEKCECSCRTENMTKNNFPQRCPYLKGYMAEPMRHQHSDMTSTRHHQHQVLHPVTAREWDSLREAACYWKEKYDRLYDTQRRLQKVNEGLEEKLLKVAEKYENEKSDLTKDVSDLTSRLVEARLTIAELEEENEQYRNDCNIAVRLLQCKPSNFVAHKFNSLPVDFQVKVKRHLNQQQKQSNRRSSSSSSLLDQCPPDVRTIKVSVPTLPPAAMVYSVDQGGKTNQVTTLGSNSGISTSSGASSSSSLESTPDHVSAAIIAKVLEERSKERKNASNINKQNRKDAFSKENDYQVSDTSTQTTPTASYQSNINALCSRCQRRIRRKSRSPSTSSTNSVSYPQPTTKQHGNITISTETAI